MRVLCAAAVLLATRALAGPAPATQDCLDCHDDPGLDVDLESGETRSLNVDPKAFAASVHGEKLACVDCHRDIKEVPHDSKPFKSLRAFSVAYYEQCKRCHFDNYTKTLDSVHYQQRAAGDERAPLCVDCHGAHDVRRPAEPRARISQTCARCHGEVSRAYAGSVHGRALQNGGDPDVPVCTDCHRAHDIKDPRTESWRLASSDLCGKCHTDPNKMARHGLSPLVMQTYLADFHGMTASLRREGAKEGARVVALCVDCHGVHDITRVDEPGSKVMRANLLQTCRRCHPDATENFPDAWLSHYEPSWDRYPLVYAVRVFYWVFIPFVIGGLILQILLHLWRVVVNR
jgi:predicted CXXCH cytochrome family protein